MSNLVILDQNTLFSVYFFKVDQPHIVSWLRLFFQRLLDISHKNFGLGLVWALCRCMSLLSTVATEQDKVVIPLRIGAAV
jgi:hypothetical protein